MSIRHRSRLRKRYQKCGTDAFDDYLLMELLLFNFIPRKDLYPEAHRLIDTFGSIEKAFAAPKEELAKIEGIGEKTAENISLFSDVMERCVAQKFMSIPMMNEGGAIPYLLWTFRLLEADTTCLLLLNQKGYLTEKNVFSAGYHVDGAIIRSCSEILKTRRPKYAILAHKHTEETTVPSGEDIEITEKFTQICNEWGVIPLKHYIVTETSAFAVSQNFTSRD